MVESSKPVHSLVLDAGPIIKNEPAISSLINRAEKLYTVPAIIAEIKDAQTRSRVQTTLQPFLTVRSPQSKSVKLVADFARRTGDIAVLSKPDLDIIALTFELECERNQGDWRLRSSPGQKRLNGSPPTIKPVSDVNQDEETSDSTAITRRDGLEQMTSQQNLTKAVSGEPVTSSEPGLQHASKAEAEAETEAEAEVVTHLDTSPAAQDSNNDLTASELGSSSAIDIISEASTSITQIQGDSESDSDGWITPSNLKRQQAKDSGASTTGKTEPAVMQAAVLTSDFAMQNVILQMNLNLLSSSLQRIKHLKTFVLRCHACFQMTKDVTKQFCPRCGQAALRRVACSTNTDGEFKLHLKSNMQWNTRGDRYSVPKPAHGSANGRVQGGGQGGWGHDLILTEDQKEYERARVVERKQKERSLMDDDYLPSILTGDRSREGGRIKVGAGRNVNSRKR